MSEKTVTVRAPASTSNCGPGFDTLGIALSLYNFVRLEGRGDNAVRAVGEVAPQTLAMVREAAGAFAAETGLPGEGFDFEVWGEVPPARGLGSSATIRAGVVAGLNAWAGEVLDREAMIRLVARLDNAPDNPCACVAGGFCIARTDPEDGGYREHVRFAIPEELVFVAVAPDYEVLTEDARRVLPDHIPFHDAARSVNSLAFLVGLLVSGGFGRLDRAVNDYLHQPYRESLNPFGRESIEAGCGAGAYTGWLSGSGSTVVCVSARDHALEVGQAMRKVYGDNGVGSRAYRLAVDNEGLRVE